MSNAKRILAELDSRLEDDVEFTLYGRAAFVSKCVGPSFYVSK